MEFRILGPIEVSRGTEAVDVPGTKAQTVLAALLLAGGRVVSDARLSFLLWGFSPPATMNAQIYTYVSRLRKRLGPEVELVRRPPGYLIRTHDARLDSLEFERLDTAGRRAHADGDFPRAAELLRSALGLWRGPALANATEYLTGEEAERLEEARANALEHRIDADLALGRHEELVPELAGLVARFPLRERLRGHFMTALYRSGRQADALDAYHRGRELLADELGVDPGPELAHVYRALLEGQLERPDSVQLVAVTSSSGEREHAPAAATLPPGGVEVVGRAGLLADLRVRLLPGGAACSAPPARPRVAMSQAQPLARILDGARSFGLGPSTGAAPVVPRGQRRVLLTGMPGVGKSTLAAGVAASLAPHYPDGQLYLGLSGAAGEPCDLRTALSRLLHALGEPQDAQGGVEELLIRYRARTAGRRLLVVLDGAVGDRQILPLLPTGPEAGVLVTARRPLATMSVADTVHIGALTRTDALCVLGGLVGADRVAAEPGAAEAIAEHCTDLPLALHIAGARLAARPHWPLARLERRLAPAASRLRELRYGDLSVTAAFESCLPDLVPADLDRLTCLAAVSHGPFRAGTGARAMDVPVQRAEDLLEDLVDAGLLEATGVDRKARPLYRFHPLVRIFLAGLSGAAADAGFDEVQAC
jgi:DNA-binding SARP family transcriptional activator